MKTKPTLYVTLGFPGSGKTHFSERLSRKLGCFHLNSDRVRHEMFPKPTFAKGEHAKVFNLMDYIAGELLARGISVIYDSNNTTHFFRNRLQRLAKNHKAKYLLVHIQTPTEVALKRIGDRHKKVRGIKKVYYKKIGPEVLHGIKNEIEPPTKTEPSVIIDGTKPFKTQYEQLIKTVSTKR